MDIPDFLAPRLVGNRFESHSIPLEFLGELAVLESMIVDVAKWLYLRDNPKRRRSPRKFTEGISLTLRGVDEGSAIPRIALALAVNSFVPTDQRHYLERSRDAIVNAIADADANKSPTDHLPRKALAYFDRLGRSLLEDEAIEFRTAVMDSPARLTKEIRRRLLKAAEVTERTEEIRIRGGVFEFNHETLAFRLRLSDGSEVSGTVGGQHFDAFREANYSYWEGVKVLIDGVGKYNRSERLQTVESVERVTILDPLDVQSQLDEIGSLKDGWYDGRGLAPTSAGLKWLMQTFNENYSDALPLPHVYPVAEGGVRFEWLFGRLDVSLEIDLVAQSGDWHSLDLDSDAEQVRRLDLNLKSDWEWLVDRLSSLRGVEE